MDQLKKELVAQEEVVTRQRDVVEKLRKDLNISGVDLNARYSDMEIETLRQMQNSYIALSVDAMGRKKRWESFKSIPVDDRMALINSELIQDTNDPESAAGLPGGRPKCHEVEGPPRLGASRFGLGGQAGRRSAPARCQLRGYEHLLEISFEEARIARCELKSYRPRPSADQILSARDRMRPFEEAAKSSMAKPVSIPPSS